MANVSENQEFKDNLSNSAWREERTNEIKSEIKEIESLDKSIINLESQINKFSSNLFKAASFLSSEFKVGTNLLGFFESFDIGTGGDKNLSLRTRGDGVQARFIPEMLDFMDSISHEKKYFIWGFEEPENSAEYKNQQILAKKLKEHFSLPKQIFITTHSEEFLSLYDGSNIEFSKRKSNLYHVKKITHSTSTESYSTINQFDVDKHSFDFANVKSDLESDIGTSLLRAKYSKEIKEKEKKLLEDIKQLEANAKEYKESNKWFLFLEDKHTNIYKIAYLKLNEIDFDAENLNEKFNQASPFNIYSKNGDTQLNMFLGSVVIDEWANKKVIGLFDFDTAYNQFNGLNKGRWEPVTGNESTCLYRKRKDHEHFYSLVIPVPDFRKTYANKRLGSSSALEIEMLFTDDKLEELNSLTKKEVAGTLDKISQFSGKKSEFWKLLIDLDTDDFINFKPLFDKITELLS
ncbi:MAG: hypothetical protein HRT37_24030 [Alteromonadaceae bacterium]|nr:hypothetical protein [Alteromonadaceae bacterium]